MSSIINIQRLSKTYTEKGSNIRSTALDDITLAIESGDFVAIAGPSGSGKTTLLNIIGALDTPTSGEVVVDGTLLSSLNSARLAEFRLKKIGFVFQAYNLVTTLTAIENTEYVALLQGISNKRRQHEAYQILKDLGLENCVNRRPGELSGGQQQRVAIARAILAQPKLVLADEPTANLDSRTGSDLIDLMKTMGSTLGITFIFATHDKMVMDKAKTLIQLHDGKIIA
ncbi:MAG: macrolide ABC transporter ATP-binding protein [Candidatus Omnitrophica bacterium CG1_02_44_16]|nr:MAG: macrolide ABC transporter ATP-binding protein [Candidatus Omnitrophica bacterium CG1_02_44_16]PIY82213.1 MAG: macrolide ABC transporter ATP-binding protein [Candidatus Omnitrophica bacterium CG_4_10_14_0_8_um_filter_44_12]PIZ84968.1 MAG: macrolide ABC transporter ATP-binding protein [Candidatus Omnitrophica bacterium CG_4_10_14_0_2_um_filter_44_9]